MTEQDIVHNITSSVREHFRMNIGMTADGTYSHAPVEVAQVAFSILYRLIGDQEVSNWRADKVRWFFRQCGFPEDFVDNFVDEDQPTAIY